jgi:transposase
MEILQAYDLTRCAHSAAQLAGVDEKTVARYVAIRDRGGDPLARPRRVRSIDPFLPKVEELVERSEGKIRADVVHQRLVVMGFAGTDRTTRRAVAEVKAAWRVGNRRTYRPWVPEPGMWLQYDWGEGPRVAGRRTQLFCAWLSWSRFRVVLPAWDQTLGTLVACLDAALRRIGGVPTYVLTDNAKTVTIDRVAGIPVRHPDIVAAGRHYVARSRPASRSTRNPRAAPSTRLRLPRRIWFPRRRTCSPRTRRSPIWPTRVCSGASGSTAARTGRPPPRRSTG